MEAIGNLIRHKRPPGRISELRGDGIEIETSVERDPFGFAYHRLKPMTRLDHFKIAADAVRMFQTHQSKS
jgi:hypothetical protein